MSNLEKHRRSLGMILPALVAFALFVVLINALYILPNESLSAAAIKIARRVHSLSTMALLIAGCILASIAWRPLSKTRITIAASLWLALCLFMLLRGKLDGLGLDSTRELFAANSSEAWGYIQSAFLVSSFETRELQALAVYAALCAPGAWILRRVTNPRTTALSIGALVTGALISGAPSSLWGGATAPGLSHYKSQLEKNASAGSFIVNQDGDINILVVIGESISREGFYAQPLTAPVPNSTTIAYQNVISPHSHTFPALYRSLGVAIDPMGDRFRTEAEIARSSIVEVMRSHGVFTEWWTNQSPTGSEDWIDELFGKFSDQFRGNSSLLPSQEWGERILDDKLIEKVIAESRVFSKPGTISFVHTYAGHWDYCNNINPSFIKRAHLPWDSELSSEAVFGDLPTISAKRHLRNISCYQAAVSYARANLERLFAAADTSHIPLVVIYFSDHGEDPYDGSAHDSSKNSFRHLQIPLVIHFNPEANRRYPHLVANSRAQSYRGHTTDVFSDTLLDLRGLKPVNRAVFSLVGSDTPYNNRYSLLRESLSGKRTIIAIDADDRDRPRNIQLAGHDYLKKRRLLASLPESISKRICAHRVNSLLKLREAIEIFSCIEMDVVIDKAHNVFINHPPKPDHKFPLAIALSSPGVINRTLWLDTKNLDPENIGIFTEVLLKSVPSEHRGNVLVETSSIDVALARDFQKLVDFGFNLSYYLPSEPANNCPTQNKSPECQKYQQVLYELFSTLPYTHLSFEKTAFGFASSLPLPRKVELATWDLSVENLEDIDRRILDRTELFIIPYRSRFDY